MLSILIGSMFLISPSNAQTSYVPNFWHPSERLTKPDLSGLPRLRFLTTTDFPPFNFIDRNKRITGFNIDLARAICDELDILAKCQIQALPWDKLQEAVEAGEAEAIIAGLQPTAELRLKFEFSRPYLYIPGRFVALRERAIAEPMALAVTRNRTGLIRRSSHAAWFREAFPLAQRVVFPDRAAALEALKDGEVDLVFSDALSLSFWLTSQSADDCCVFAGGPYFAPVDFRRGLAIAFPRGRTDLASAANYALRQINDNGVYAELYLRYFPISLY